MGISECRYWEARDLICVKWRLSFCKSFWRRLRRSGSWGRVTTGVGSSVCRGCCGGGCGGVAVGFDDVASADNDEEESDGLIRLLLH